MLIISVGKKVYFEANFVLNRGTFMQTDKDAIQIYDFHKVIIH
jgi:hypothetical protein